MSEIDYEELISSPLDDLDRDPASGWGTAVAGAFVGVGAALALVLVLGGDAEESEPAATAAPTTQTSIAAPAVAADYPPGFTELVPGVGANIGEVIVDEEVVAIAFTTAVIRGSDPFESDWPLGGVWLLESASGTVAESSRVVVGRFSPSAFTVQFPARVFNGATDFVAARIIERWDPERLTGSVSLPFSGEPFAAPEPLTIPVSQDVTLMIPALKLGRFLGSVEWATTGTPLGAAVDLRVTLLDDDGEVIGSYARFPEIVDPSAGGVAEVFWRPSFPTDQEGAATAVIDYTVTVPQVTPVSIEYDLRGVPLGR